MPKIKLSGDIRIRNKEYYYKPELNEMELDKLLSRIERDRGFLKIFSKNMTNWFIKMLEDTVNPDIKHEQNCIISLYGETGCQPKGSKVLMADGTWKNIEDIREGMLVMSFNKDLKSKFATVIRTTKWICDEHYQISQMNRHKKNLYSCSYNHIIPFYRRKTYRIMGQNLKRKIKWVIDESHARYFNNFSKKRLSHNIMGITMPAINYFFKKINCEIEPYTLGVYISDGTFKHYRNENKSWRSYLNITKDNEEVMAYINQHYPVDRINKKRGTTCKTYSWFINSGFARQLKKYNYNGVKSDKKFIPESALFSDLEYRKKLLAGLIDGDGYYSNGYYELVSKSSKLIQQMEFLIHSVGGRVNQIKRKKGKIKSYGFKNRYWLISFFIHENLNIPIISRKKQKKSFYKTANRVSIAINKTENPLIKTVYGFTLSGETGYYITDNYMLTHNSGKSSTMISLSKEITPKTFSYQNIAFYDQQVLDIAKIIPRDSFVIRDEAVKVFGVGSTRLASDITVLSETARKYGLNLIFISPTEQEISVAKYILETVDIDYNNRITRLAIKDPVTNSYRGALYVKVLPETDKDMIIYNKRKDEFIENVKDGKRAGAKSDYKTMAIEVVDKIDIDIFRTKKQRLTFIRTEYPHITVAEADMIATYVEIVIDRGKYVLMEN